MLTRYGGHGAIVVASHQLRWPEARLLDHLESRIRVDGIAASGRRGIRSWNRGRSCSWRGLVRSKDVLLIDAIIAAAAAVAHVVGLLRA